MRRLQMHTEEISGSKSFSTDRVRIRLSNIDVDMDKLEVSSEAID